MPATDTITIACATHARRIDHFLAETLACSRTRIQASIRRGDVQLNGVPAKASCPIKPDDTIQLLPFAPSYEETITPEPIPLAILHEDEDLLIVNKAASMVMHPACGNWRGTLANALLYHYGQLPPKEGNPLRPGLVHRLDKGTSGLLVVAKTEQGLVGLTRQFATRTITKTYLALVWGNLQGSGTIDQPLRRSHHDRRIMAVAPQGSGKAAITHYEVLEQLGHVTLIRCRLATGRTHQIRAHMKWLGHPLFGDPRYGGDRIRGHRDKGFVRSCFELLPHQALHASALRFIHPRTGTKCLFRVDPPPPLATLLDRWRQYAARIT